MWYGIVVWWVIAEGLSNVLNLCVVVQLLGEEYALMSPGTLEAHGLSSNRDTSDHASDPHRKIAGKNEFLISICVVVNNL